MQLRKNQTVPGQKQPVILYKYGKQESKLLSIKVLKMNELEHMFVHC